MDSMAVDLEIDEAIRARGLRRTAPRALVASTLATHAGHHTVGEIQTLLEADHPGAGGVALSSVYRALEALEGAGLVVALRSAAEEARFEWEGNHSHHHLICEDCGHTREVALDAVHSLEREARQQHNFQTRVRHLALRGTCGPCRDDQSASEAAPASQTRSPNR